MGRSGAKQKLKARTTTVVNESQSVQVVKNTLRASVSVIAYMRHLFPEDCFECKDWADMEVYQLQSNLMDSKPQNIHAQQAQALQDWIDKGVFPALELRYLRKLEFLIVKPGDVETDGKTLRPDSLLERYTWGFQYGPCGEVSLEGTGVVTRQNMKDQITRLIRNLLAFSTTLPGLPRTRYLTMKMLYYEDITPPGYQPEFFQEAPSSMLASFGDVISSELLNIKMGSVETQYHTLRLRFEGIDPQHQTDKISSEMSDSLGGLSVSKKSVENCPTMPPPAPRSTELKEKWKATGKENECINTPPQSVHCDQKAEYSAARKFVVLTGETSESAICNALDVEDCTAKKFLSAMCLEGLLCKPDSINKKFMLTARGKKESLALQRTGGVMVTRTDKELIDDEPADLTNVANSRNTMRNSKNEINRRSNTPSDFSTPPISSKRRDEAPRIDQSITPLSLPCTLGSKRVIAEGDCSESVDNGYEVSLSQQSSLTSFSKCSMVSQPLRQGAAKRSRK